jgi:hypothetical protein
VAETAQLSAEELVPSSANPITSSWLAWELAGVVKVVYVALPLVAVEVPLVLVPQRSVLRHASGCTRMPGTPPSAAPAKAKQMIAISEMRRPPRRAADIGRRDTSGSSALTTPDLRYVGLARERTGFLGFR